MVKDRANGWSPYTPVAERRKQMQAALAKLKKQGIDCQPVVAEGRKIAQTPWGRKWCDNVDGYWSYRDYGTRLYDGRTCVRSGAVLDLRITAGMVDALVFDGAVCKVRVGIRELPETGWDAFVAECAGETGLLVDLLQGQLTAAVMKMVMRPDASVLPTAKQIGFTCTCKDKASMCKHVAAALYAVGNRLDSQPELLFKLRNVDPEELIRQAGIGPAASANASASSLDEANLSALFGIELDTPVPKKRSRRKQT
jgi:uncharacterized Zn finger protein